MKGATATAWWIAIRYLVTRRRQFGAFITRISVAGLSLGVLVLTVVVSVMNGFDAELRERLLGTVPHLLVEDRSVDDPGVAALATQPGVQSLYNFFVGAGMVTAHGAVNPVTLYGIDETAIDAMPTIANSMSRGSLSSLLEQPRGLLLGRPLATHLGLLTGDTLALVISEPGAGGVEPRILRYQLAGVFEVGAELDYSLAIVSRGSLIDALGGPARPGAPLQGLGRTGVRVTLDDPLTAAGVARALMQQHPDWSVSSWADSYGELFQAVRLEKVMMFLILLMVVAVAAFNIVSGQSMAVLDKRADIAILRTMGASDATVQRIFLLQGLVISTVGIVVGLAVGAVLARHIGRLIAATEDWTGFRLLEGTYFVEIPSVVLPSDLAIIAAMSWSLCLFSAWLPARRAANLSPVAGLHG